MPELISIRLGIEGVDEINARLGLAIDRIKNPIPAHAEALEKVVEPWLRRRFASGGAKGWKSQRFTPWKHYEDEPRYLGRKQGMLGVGKRRKKLAPLLWRKGRATTTPAHNERLFRSFTGDPGVGRRDHFRRIKRTGFEIGSRVPYAANHQFGVGWQEWDRKRVPQRKIIERDPKLFRALVNGYQRFVFKDKRGGIRESRVILTKADAREAFRNA